MVAKLATGEIEEDVDDDGKDKAAQELGRKGGQARAEKMTPERRREAQARPAWLLREKKFKQMHYPANTQG